MGTDRDYSLERVYAFTVSPLRLVEEGSAQEPIGGPARLTPQLRELIDKVFGRAKTSELTTVDFVPDDDRQHDVRQTIMDVAFGLTRKPAASASVLASSLARAMDKRSHSALLLVTLEKAGDKRRVSMLLLPREDAVQVTGSSDEVLVNVLPDAFSTESRLRKMARAEGHDSKTQFLSAEILDLQLWSHKKVYADFWIRDFLKAQPRIDSATGSRYLCGALQQALKVAKGGERDAVVAAMLKAQSGTVRRTSLAQYARELPEGLRPVFLRGVENAEHAQSVFDVSRSAIQAALGRFVYTTEDDVVISAPPEAVGKTVELTQDGESRLIRYQGRVTKENVARRKGPKGKVARGGR